VRVLQLSTPVTTVGKRTVLHLAELGAHVIMAAHSMEKGQEAMNEIEIELNSKGIENAGQRLKVLNPHTDSQYIYYLFSKLS
jgi:NAD(P)-dependent dehydrogenase (short-subunit alcohol dehydrogenase family)